MLGRLQLVRSVTAISVKLREETVENGSQVDQICKVSECSVAFTDEIRIDHRELNKKHPRSLPYTHDPRHT